MTIQQDIDKLFKKGLSDYSETPPGFIWDNIERKLNNKRSKKKRNIIYSIAASVALLLSFGAGYMFTDIKSNNFVAVNVTEELPTVELAKETKKEEATNNNNIIIESKSKKTEPFDNELIKEDGKSNEIIEQKIATPEDAPAIEPNKNIKRVNSSGTLLPPMFGSSNEYEADKVLIVNEDKQNENTLESIEMRPLNASNISKDRDLNYDYRQLAAVSDYVLITPDEKKIYSWSVGVSAAPLLSYRNVETVSSENLKSADVNSSYEQNYDNEKPLMSYSAGVNVNCKVAKRWRIQSGLYFSEMGQVSENMSLEQEQNYVASENSSYTINTSTGNIEVQGSQNELIDKFSGATRVQGDNMLEEPSTTGNYEKSNSSIETSFVQTYEFYEVPIVVNYTIIDRKLSMNVNGGLSANILYNNSAYVENDGNRYELDAQSEDLKSMNYSGVFGLGLEYPIISKLRFNFQPTFTYALSSINTSGTVYPYSFGLYTGLRYSF